MDAFALYLTHTAFLAKLKKLLASSHIVVNRSLIILALLLDKVLIALLLQLLILSEGLLLLGLVRRLSDSVFVYLRD